MVEVYEGRLGGGKTYSAVVRMVDHIRRGGIVCTNVEVRWDEIKAYVARKFNLVAEDDQYIPLSDDQVGLFHRYTPSGTPDLPVLVVLDEAHLTFNARDFAKTDKLYRETLTFLTQSRKVATDVIFISQSAFNMDKQFMRLVQFIWRFRDMSKWRIPALGIAWPLQQILAVQFDYDGKTILQRSFVRKDPSVFKLYNTNSLLRDFPRLDAAVRTKRTLEKATKTSRPMGKILIPLGLVIGIVCAWFLYKNITSIGTPEQTEKLTGKKPQPAATATPPPQTARSVNTTKQPAPVTDVAYEIYAEKFVAWNGQDRALKTDSGWYQVGELSHRGFVQAVSDRRAKINLPNGKTGWVVASSDQARPVATPTPAPIAKPNQTPVVVPDSGIFPPEDSVFQRETVQPTPRSSPMRFKGQNEKTNDRSPVGAGQAAAARPTP